MVDNSRSKRIQLLNDFWETCAAAGFYEESIYEPRQMRRSKDD